MYIYLHFDFSYHPLMDLEVRHLRVIHAIAEYGSISKAASSLGLSQPSLAGQLQRIERMFGGRLLQCCVPHNR
ncbi:helix-turn-helix domain-containing protein [Streptosporangium roseum]